MSGELMLLPYGPHTCQRWLHRQINNIGHNLITTRGRAFLFLMCISYEKTFHVVSSFLTL